MIFLLDTCFCSHCSELNDENILDIRPFLQDFRLGITEIVKGEILNYRLEKFIPIDNFLIITISEINFSKFQEFNEFLNDLDLADQSIWIAGYMDKKNEYLILTDDGELLLECQISNINAMRLPSFLIFLCKSDILSKNQVIKCIKYWEKKGRFGKKDLKKWREELLKLRT